MRRRGGTLVTGAADLTPAAGGRTRAVHLRPGPGRGRSPARREAAEYERFRDRAGQVTEVNETTSGPARR